MLHSMSHAVVIRCTGHTAHTDPTVWIISGSKVASSSPSIYSGLSYVDCTGGKYSRCTVNEHLITFDVNVATDCNVFGY